MARAFVWIDFSIRRILMQWMRNLEFGFDFFVSARHGSSGDFWFENPKDDSLIEQILLQIFDEEHSIIVGRDEGPAPASLQADPKWIICIWSHEMRGGTSWCKFYSHYCRGWSCLEISLYPPINKPSNGNFSLSINLAVF